MNIPGWLVALLVGSSGIVGYLFRGWIEDRFARAKEARALQHADIRALRDALHTFLGQPRAHFQWLCDVQDVRNAGGAPSPDEKARIIATWVYENAMKYPPARRPPMYLIANVAYQLARGDRHYLAANYDTVIQAQNALDQYAKHLTRELHNPEGPRALA